MARYHLTPNGPKTCSAKFRCQYKDNETGAEPEHYDNKAAAQAAFEKGEESGGDFMQGTKAKSSPVSLAEKLKTQAPVDIDKTLAELYYKHAVISNEISDLNNAVIEYGKRFDLNDDSYDSRHFKRKYEEAVKQAEQRTPELLVKLAESKKEMEPYENEFDRRGGWTRAFLVDNVNGHVHGHMECGTCFPTTKYSWMTDYSGKDESEIVEAAGERACTVCYPTAPTDGHMNSPTRMFTPDEIAKQAAREERARISQEKADKKKAAGIFAADGGELELPRFRKGNPVRGERVSSERSAQIMAVDLLMRIAITDQDRKDYEAKGVTDGINEDYYQQQKGDVEVLVEALARKRGMTEDEVLKDLNDRAEKKKIAQLKEWAKVEARMKNRS